jgi:hypothetical protein
MRVGEYEGSYNESGIQCSVYDIGDSDPKVFCKDWEFLGAIWFASVPRTGEMISISQASHWDRYIVEGICHNGIKLEIGTSSRSAGPTLYVRFLEKIK